MDKTLSHLCVTFGLFLMLFSIYLQLFNRAQNREAGEASAIILSEIRTAIPAESTAPADPTIAQSQAEHREAYLGFLSIPALELELPVLDNWDYDKLKQAPCRFSGSLWEGNLAVMAHNYDHHFGTLSSLSPGDGVYFTDSNGLCVPFQVVSTDILAPSAVTEVTENAYDLTLFTCTYGGKNRVVIYCKKILTTEKSA